MNKEQRELARAKADLRELIQNCKAAALFPPKTGAAWYAIARRLEGIAARLPDEKVQA